MAKKPDLLISYDNTIPKALMEPFAEAVSAPGLELAIEVRPSTVFAGVQWLLPTAVIIYIARSYFDGYLKEAGKEHYHLLKNAIASLWSSFSGRDRAVRVELIGTRGKIAAGRRFSVAISVMAEASAGLRFKLLLADASSAEELNLAIAGFLEFLGSYFGGRLDTATELRLSAARVFNQTILVAYDKASGLFVFLDPTSSATDSE
jgi:hypothetical protein